MTNDIKGVNMTLKGLKKGMSPIVLPMFAGCVKCGKACAHHWHQEKSTKALIKFARCDLCMEHCMEKEIAERI